MKQTTETYADLGWLGQQKVNVHWYREDGVMNVWAVFFGAEEISDLIATRDMEMLIQRTEDEL